MASVPRKAGVGSRLNSREKLLDVEPIEQGVEHLALPPQDSEQPRKVHTASGLGAPVLFIGGAGANVR